jgi:putative membrane protein
VEHDRGEDHEADDREQELGRRGFAERMVQDHTTANQKLLSLAQSVSNTSQTKIDQKHQAMLQQLSQLSGEDFDPQYMQEQVQDHQAAVKLLASEATQPSGLVDQLAGEFLPTLREHLQMAQEISKSMHKR